MRLLGRLAAGVRGRKCPRILQQGKHWDAAERRTGAGRKGGSGGRGTSFRELGSEGRRGMAVGIRE